jgi:hypothetical protein
LGSGGLHPIGDLFYAQVRSAKLHRARHYSARQGT